MTLGELKASLRKLSSDFDDTHVMMHTLDDSGKSVFDLLTFTSYTVDFTAIVLGGWSLAKQMAKEGKLSPEQSSDILKLADDDDEAKQQPKPKRKKKNGNKGNHDDNEQEN
jgi:hypothetical protein